MEIDGFQIGGGKVFIVAETGASHCRDFQKAVDLVRAAKEAGADAVKLQTFRPEDMTLDCDGEHFQIKEGLWRGQTLFELYRKTYLPWAWQPMLKNLADEIGISLFSTPFSLEAVDFLEKAVKPPAYKIASFNIVDYDLLKAVSATGKPVFISTGAAKNYREISLATRRLGRKRCVPLHCVSKYPAPSERFCLRTIPSLSQLTGCHVGISDHSQGIAITLAAVALDARVVERHIKLPQGGGADDAFSLTPDEFQEMVKAIRQIEKAVPGANFEGSSDGHRYRPSLHATIDIKIGEKFTEGNIRYVRPAGGLEQKENILGKTAKCNISIGTPLTADLVACDLVA